jgi:signal transduction histidine kinase
MSFPAASELEPITIIRILYERDVVVARQQVRKIAELAGFDHQDQIRIATSVSELARNAFQYAGGGRAVVEAALTRGQTGLAVTVADEGPGISDVDAILQGRYQSQTGMGKGLLGTQRLMDQFALTSSPGSGTSVRFVKRLPRRTPDLTREKAAAIRTELEKQLPDDPFSEIQRQNQELMRTLDELRARQEELAELNSELEATNRGVVALYAELDERANYLRKVSDLKSRFLSNMSHEFRTPLNSIRTLAGMLLEELDGPLVPEQEKQVTYIQHAAAELAALVDDLLDLAKAEAGRLTVRLAMFDIASLFNLLRGLLKPLTNKSQVNLVLDEPENEIVIFSDEGKVSQILRNFISNALKFTPAGEVRVTATPHGESDVIFAVSDTGIGIRPEHIELIFEEFSQVEGSLQEQQKGTGLGLPLSRRLAELLGGRVWVESTPGKGSTFFLSLPRHLDQIDAGRDAEEQEDTEKTVPRILIIDDDQVSRYVLQNQFSRVPYQVMQAASGEEGLRLAQSRPNAIFLDLSMPGMSGFQVLDRLKTEENTRSIPVIINTSMELSAEQHLDLQNRGASAILSKGDSFVEKAAKAVHDLLNDRALPSA